MEDKVLEAPAETPAADELLAELRRRAPTPLAAAPPAALAKLEISVEDASMLYAVLRQKSETSAPANPPASEPPTPRSDPARLLRILEDRLREVPATAGPLARVVLELQPHEAGFLHRIIEHKKCDAFRREQTRYKHFPSWDALLEEDAAAETEGKAAGHAGSADTQSPETALLQAEIRQALAELPEELAGLLGALQDANGNVSELARRLGQPQRKTARQIERLRRHLQEKGLAP